MEDKRTLLAFLLIGLILFGMPYYLDLVGMGPPDESDPAQTNPAEYSDQSTDSSTLAPVPAPPSNPASVASDDLPPRSGSSIDTSSEPIAAQSFVPREVPVATPYQDFIFSSAGGDLISAQLLKYQLGNGDAVQLLPAGVRGLSLSIEEKDKSLSLSDIEFIADQSALRVDEGQSASLSFSANLGQGRRLTKTYEFFGDRYGFELHIDLSGFSIDETVYLHWNKGIPITESNPEVDLLEMRALSYLNEDLTEIRADEDVENYSNKGALRWTGIRNKYFLTALVPLNSEPLRINLVGTPSRQQDFPPDLSYSVGLDLQREDIRWSNLVFIGPLDYEELVDYDVELEKAIDLGWPVIRDISGVLIVVFVWAHGFIPNYGIVIILFAFVVKLLLFPFTRKTYESTAKMQELQPKIAALRDKYKNDNQRLSRETMKLYKDEGVNPLGGCLPLLPQMPIFFALYNVFSSTIELRQAPFILWINDLSVPDEIMIAGLGVHVLPLFMALSMFFQQKMTMKDPKQAFLVYLMPVMMIFFFWSISSGLVLYWTVFNVLTILQQVLTNKSNPT
jgi:YidC/Oxa1 family membrane protein insertase